MKDKYLNFLSSPWFYVVMKGYKWTSCIYQKIYVPFKINKIRKKDTIDVVFVIYELGAWKTENLYNRMLEHPRFNPQIVVIPYLEEDYAYNTLKKYLESRQYNYSTLSSGDTISRKFHPDIIFYQKPYPEVIEKKYGIPYNLRSLFCHVEYCFRNRNIPGRILKYYYFMWQIYAENETVVREAVSLGINNYKNLAITGLPVMDELLKDKKEYIDPWKPNGKKKRIIYAPHHTVVTKELQFTSPYSYSTFFDYADFMLAMAEKYKDRVQWAFKPHPQLRAKLNKIWGVKKTNDYYETWEKMSNAQLFDGPYMDLFKHSDAMIHDCGSFKLEYLYTGSPVMYLIKEDNEFDFPNWQTRESLKLHYHGKSKADIENFILNVINEIDPIKEERNRFVKDYLTPPNGNTACDNIINAILG